MAKRPSFQFYPGDWLRDTALRSCSVAARGLWLEMICLMHEGTPYGTLKVGEKVILPSNLCRMVGATLEEVEGWLRELRDARVYSVDEEGAIYSRRMKRDEEVRQKRAAGGILGGNPALMGGPKVGEKVNLPPNLLPTPSSASASAFARREEEATQAPPPEPPAPSVDVRLKIFRKRNLLTEAECSRLAGLMDRDPLGKIGETPKVTDEPAMRAERLARLASLWQVTSPLAGDGDGPFELWAEWRRQSRKKGGKSGPDDWRNEVECLRALQAPGRTPAEMLAGLRGVRGNWRSFDYAYLEGGNGSAASNKIPRQNSPAEAARRMREAYERGRE